MLQRHGLRTEVHRRGMLLAYEMMLCRCVLRFKVPMGLTLLLLRRS